MDKIYIKNEDGKEVAYKTSWFDTEIKIGELHERSDGSKETRNFSGENVTLERPDNGIFANPRERAGSVDGEEEGTFSKDTVFDFEVENSPSFKPHRSKGNLENKVASAHATSHGSDCSDNSSSSAFTQTPSPRKINYFKRALYIIIFGLPLSLLTLSTWQTNKNYSIVQRSLIPPSEENFDILFSDYLSNSKDNNYIYILNSELDREVKDEISVFYIKKFYYIDKENKTLSYNVTPRKSYPISKLKYPEFYKKLNLRGDGKITTWELMDVQHDLTRIAKKYSEGNIEAIVKEFSR